MSGTETRTMTEQEAIDIALKLIEAEDWPVMGKISARRARRWWFFGPYVWFVMSSLYGWGEIVIVEIDDATGEILQQGFKRH